MGVRVRRGGFTRVELLNLSNFCPEELQIVPTVIKAKIIADMLRSLEDAEQDDGGGQKNGGEVSCTLQRGHLQ